MAGTATGCVGIKRNRKREKRRGRGKNCLSVMTELLIEGVINPDE